MRNINPRNNEELAIYYSAIAAVQESGGKI